MHLSGYAKILSFRLKQKAQKYCAILCIEDTNIFYDDVNVYIERYAFSIIFLIFYADIMQLCSGNQSVSKFQFCEECR